MITLLIGGVDYTSSLVNQSVSISQTNDGLNSTCSFDLNELGVLREGAWTVQQTLVGGPDRITDYVVLFPATKIAVSVTEGATVHFAGIVARASADSVFDRNRLLHIECQDFNQMLEELIIYDLEEYGAQTDGFIINDLFFKYSTGIDYATHVTPSGYVFDLVEFENMTLRQALDKIAAETECIWYVDYSQRLHYATSEANAPGWFLSDKYDNVNSFPYYDDITKECDAANMVNSLFLVGGAVGLWFEDATSIAEYGYHRAIIVETDLVDPDDMEAYADKILNQYKDPEVFYKLKTERIGLRAGMNVRLVNSLQGVDDTLLITNLTLTFTVDEEVPVFDITLGGSASSVSASAQRANLDAIKAAQGMVKSSKLVLASRGWGHDMTFSATDDDTVAWTAGTITCAGGLTFSINAGNTDDPGAMVAKTIIYLDTVISATDLQMTTNEEVAIGNNRIMVAVAWPSGIVTVNAGFQVFGATPNGPQSFLNADNIVGNSITANEIFGNTLSVISANMGVLDAGTINMFAGVWDVNATGFRLNATEIAGQTAGTDQIVLSAAEGILRAGAGAVKLDVAGVGLYGIDDANQIRCNFLFDDTGTDRVIGSAFGRYNTGGAGTGIVYLESYRIAGDPWAAIGTVIRARDDVAGVDARIVLTNGPLCYGQEIDSFSMANTTPITYFYTGADAYFRLGDAGGVRDFEVRDSNAVAQIRVGSAGGVRILHGLRIGSTAGDAPDNNLIVDGLAGGGNRDVGADNAGLLYVPFVSDAKFKHNAEPVVGALEAVCGLQGMTFDWDLEALGEIGLDFKNSGRQIGFMAQDVEEFIPLAVSIGKGYKSVDDKKIIPYLAAAIKELREENQILRERVEKLE